MRPIGGIPAHEFASSDKAVNHRGLAGVAAIAVVLCHAARHVDKVCPTPYLITVFQPGHAGVDLFFTISGFIIPFVHYGDVGTPERLPHYLGRRFTRVMPLYWLALVLTLAMSALAGHHLPDPATLLWSVALLPSVGEPLLGIAWTLQFEIVFYTVFAVTIVNRRVGLTMLAAWLAWILATAGGLGSAGIPNALCGFFAIQFFMGMAAARLVSSDRIPAPLLVAAVGLVLFSAVLALESAGILDGFGLLARVAYGIPAALLVAGLAQAERADLLSASSWMRTLGGASYSIYLFQFVFIGSVWQVWQAVGLQSRLPLLALFVPLVVAAVGGGVLIARFVERPLLRAIRSPPETTSCKTGLTVVRVVR